MLVDQDPQLWTPKCLPNKVVPKGISSFSHLLKESLKGEWCHIMTKKKMQVLICSPDLLMESPLFEWVINNILCLTMTLLIEKLISRCQRKQWWVPYQGAHKNHTGKPYNHMLPENLNEHHGMVIRPSKVSQTALQKYYLQNFLLLTHLHLHVYSETHFTSWQSEPNILLPNIFKHLFKKSPYQRGKIQEFRP